MTSHWLRGGPGRPTGMKASRASEMAHVSCQVGACVALKRQVVSERGGGWLAAAPFVLPGTSAEVLPCHLALSELLRADIRESDCLDHFSSSPGAFLVESIMPPARLKMLVEFPNCCCQQASLAGHLLSKPALVRSACGLWLRL